MSNFILKPNLPQRKVKKIICGTNDENILSFFDKHSIEVIPIKANLTIDPSIALHADISALHLGLDKIIVDTVQSDLIENLYDIGMKVYTTCKSISGNYPYDIALNFAVIGKHIVGNFRYADDNLSELAVCYDKISVKQGYSKCSILVVDEKAIITDDVSIHKKMISEGVDSLLISKGDITLNGHEYGFIGGASFKISKDTIVFCGDISGHRDYIKIKAFIEKYECQILSTDKLQLRDIGGIISLTEE